MAQVVSDVSQIDPECPGCVQLTERLSELQAIVEKLGAKIERLEARKPKTSRTSSKPPSSDGPWTTRESKKERSGKKRGGH